MTKIIAVLFTFIALLGWVSPVQAKVIFNDSAPFTLGSQETVNDDLFIGAESVVLDGTVNGNVYAGTNTFTLNGIVNGDLVLGAETVIIRGTVRGDVYLGAGRVTVESGKIGGGLVAGTGTLIIDDQSSVGGSLITGAGQVRNSAQITRSAMIGAGSLYLNSRVGQELRFGGRDLALGPRANVGGDLHYALGETEGTFTQDPSSTVGGTISRYTPPPAATSRDFSSYGRSFALISFLGALLTGLLILKLWPKSTLLAASIATKQAWNTLGTGFLLTVFILPILLVLALSIIGLPLAGLIFVLFLVELYLGKLVISLALGQFLARNFNLHWTPTGNFIFGLAIFYLLRIVPLAGVFITLILTWMGLGSLYKYSLLSIQRKS